MDQNDRAKQLHQGDSQTNLNYWKIIRDCSIALSSCQDEFQTASNQAINHLDLSQELSIANVQLTINHTKSALKNDLCCPNSSTANCAESDFRSTYSMVQGVQQFFGSTSRLTTNDKVNRQSNASKSVQNSVSSVQSESVSMSSSTSALSSLVHQSIERVAKSSIVSDSVDVSQILSSRSRALNKKASSILTKPTSSSNDDITVLPIKVLYYDIDSNQLVKKGLATGGYGQMINVTDLVPLPKNYHPYFYQKLYYNITTHPQTAVIFVTNHKINLRVVTQHQLIHNKVNSHKAKLSSLSAKNQFRRHYLNARDFHSSSLWYLLIKKDLFVHSQKNLNQASRSHKLINGEIVPIKRLINYQNKVIALLPNDQYITARKDFVTVFKV